MSERAGWRRKEGTAWSAAVGSEFETSRIESCELSEKATSEKKISHNTAMRARHSISS